MSSSRELGVWDTRGNDRRCTVRSHRMAAREVQWLGSIAAAWELLKNAPGGSAR